MSETEPEVEETEVNDGVPGQIMYPETVVDAERAGAYAAGDEVTLEPDRDETENERVARIQSEQIEEFRAEQESESEEA